MSDLPRSAPPMSLPSPAATADVAGQRRRGRPQRLAVDPATATTPAVNVGVRASWLISTLRLHGPDARWQRRETFCEAARDLGIAIDGTRLSRWESGSLTPSTAVIETYEHLLAIPDGHLIAILNAAQRAVGTGQDTWPSPEISAVEFEHCIAALADPHGLRAGAGPLWQRVAADLCRHDRVYLPPELWSRLCHRLVRELSCSVGVAYARRYDAAARLIRHPNARRHMTMAIGAHLTDPDVQIARPAMSLLAEVDDPGVTDLVLRLMGSGNDVIRTSAAAVAAYKLHHSTMEDRELEQLERYAAWQLGKEGALTRRIVALEIAVSLPDASFERLRAGLLGHGPARRLDEMRAQCELVAPEYIRAVVRGSAILAQSLSGLGVAAEPDQQLERLIREGLVHLHQARRHHALALIAASPYAEGVRKAMLALTEESQEFIALRAWSTLARLGAGEAAPRVLERALQMTDHRSASLALVAAAKSVTGLSASTSARLTQLATTSPPGPLRHAAHYVLGMVGAHRDEGEPEARWWRDLGGHLVEDPLRINPLLTAVVPAVSRPGLDPETADARRLAFPDLYPDPGP